MPTSALRRIDASWLPWIERLIGGVMRAGLVLDVVGLWMM